MLNLDYFILDALVDELAPQIAGARIGKIHQPADDCMILRLWNGRQNLRLLIKTGQGARLHLTEQDYPNPFHPPRFCQLLRSRLARLKSLRMHESERIVEFHFGGHGQDYRLVCELFGARSNLYLLDDQGLLLDALHKPQEFAGRRLRRGQPYQSPPQQEKQPLRDLQALPPGITTGEALEGWLLENVQPMSKGQALALKLAVGVDADIQLIFKRFVDGIRQKAYTFATLSAGQKTALVAYLPAALDGARTIDGSLSQFLDQTYAPAEAGSAEIGDRSRYRQIVAAQLKRLKKRLSNIATEQHNSEGFDERRHLGELLLANLHLVRRGMTEIEVSDWQAESPQKVRIPLDSKLSPQQNAERLFKRYKKEKRGVVHVERRQQETADEISWLEGLQLALEEELENVELHDVGQELQAAGLISPAKGAPPRRHQQPDTPRLNQTRSPEGRRIFWGRNNRSNDYLSSRMTDRDDLWFHAHNMPGCHLVLKRDGRQDEIAAEEIAYAARIAAGYSRGKDDARVEVIISEGRFVSRPKGAKPGLVRVSEYRTIVVEPLRLPSAEKAQ